ncbi:MAG: hypothetical protein ACREKE_00480 [bacterium]
MKKVSSWTLVALAVVLGLAALVAVNWKSWPAGTAWIQADKTLAYQIVFLDKNKAQFLADAVVDYKLSADQKSVVFSLSGKSLAHGVFTGGLLDLYPANGGTLIFKAISNADLDKYDEQMRQSAEHGAP